MYMRVSFYNQYGNLEVCECDKIEVDTNNFDFSQEQGFINVKLRLPQEEVTLQIANPTSALEYMRSIESAVETGVIKMNKNDAKEIVRDRVVQEFKTDSNRVIHVSENVYTNEEREKSEYEKRREEIERLFR